MMFLTLILIVKLYYLKKIISEDGAKERTATLPASSLSSKFIVINKVCKLLAKHFYKL